MAKLEIRGYVNKLEHKESANGGYVKYTLAAQQKRRTKEGEVKEKLYVNCVDFSGNPPEEGAYVEAHGWVTISGWCKGDKGGANIDLKVTGYGDTGDGSAKASAPKAKAPAQDIPDDPFAL